MAKVGSGADTKAASSIAEATGLWTFAIPTGRTVLCHVVPLGHFSLSLSRDPRYN